jgi:Fe2+ transport system protein FeoA
LPFSSLALPSPDPRAALPLSHLNPGASGVIERVELASGVGRRLLDLGFVPGTAVRVLRRAPLGDPVSYELRGVRIALRRSEAARIWVRVEAPAGEAVR